MHVVVRALSEKEAKRKVSNRLNVHRATKKSYAVKEPPRAVEQPATGGRVCATSPKTEISDRLNVAVKTCPLDMKPNKEPLQLSRNKAASVPIHPKLLDFSP
jgi:hypothetical protein